VLVAGEIFGFLGILLAVPRTAVIKVFWRDVVAFYRGDLRWLSSPVEKQHLLQGIAQSGKLIQG
jgi:predicted PurR-regulated permease PerM